MSTDSFDDDVLSLPKRGPNSLPKAWIASLSQHPKDVWAESVDLGGVTRFWLNKHRTLRESLRAIEALLGNATDGKLDLIENLTHFHGLLFGFGQDFELHHHAEDHHYFPLYVQAAPDLTKGFVLLEADHQFLHQALVQIFSDARRIFQCALNDHEIPRDQLIAMKSSSGRLHKFLTRHLDDEEDVIVPFVLSRGEDKLFGNDTSSVT